MDQGGALAAQSVRQMDVGQRAQPALGLQWIAEHTDAQSGRVDERGEQTPEPVVFVIRHNESDAAAERVAQANELEGDLPEFSDRWEVIHLAHIDQRSALMVSKLGGDVADRSNGLVERDRTRGLDIGEVAIGIDLI